MNSFMQATEPQDNNTAVQETVENVDAANSPTNSVYLARGAYLTPAQSEVVQVNVASCKSDIGMITPTGNMAKIYVIFKRRCGQATPNSNLFLYNN